MPVPSGAEIATMANLQGVPTQHAFTMAQALGDAISEEFQVFTQQNQVLPGIATSAMPPAMVGVTAAPGQLTGVVNPKVVIEQTVDSHIRSLALDAGQKQTLKDMLSVGLVDTLQALSRAQVLPGVPVASGMTTAPMRLVAPEVTALAATLKITLKNMNPSSQIPAAPVFNQPGQVGMCLPADPAKSIADLLGQAAVVFLNRVMVAPGIPLAGSITAAPGMLV